MIPETNLMRVCFYPHSDIHQGSIIAGENTVLDLGCLIDLTGSVSIGSYCMIGRGTQILTHDHYHEGQKPLLLLQEEKGVKWQDKIIQDDVWLHSCVILYQVTFIPTGTVIGAGSILTRNIKNEYEIWAGNPAIRIGER